MGNRYSFYLQLTLLSSDFFLVNLAYFLGSIFARDFNFEAVFSKFEPTDYFFFIFTWLLSSSFLKLYSRKALHAIEKVLRRTIYTILVQAFFYTIFLFLTSSNISEKFLVSCYSLIALFFILSRFFITYKSKLFFSKVKQQKKIAIIGRNEKGQKLAEYFSTSKSDYSFEGFIETEETLYIPNKREPIFQPVGEYIDYAAKNKIDELYYTILPNQHEVVKELVRVADQHCVRLKFVPDFSQKIDNQYYLNYVGEFPVISFRNEPLEDMDNRLKKRIFDIAFSLCVTVFILSWLIPLIGIIIKLDSKGPIFYRQNRAGRNNRHFRIFKFRTMKVVEADGEYKQATKNDARITRVGKFLRKTSLDEMPQFLNVLLGDMSIIGPRPHPLKLNETFMDSIDSYMARHFVKPGITGWAQVNGFRGETNEPMLMQKRIEHDIWYVENWSVMLDIRIVFMTIINLTKSEQYAY